MPEKIRHLREEDRRIIHRMHKEKFPQTQIARLLGFSQGTISKELRRNTGRRGYRPKQAHSMALARKHGKRARSSAMTGFLTPRVIAGLASKHSPQQISGSLALAGQQVSASTIYRFIIRDKATGGTLHLNLRINGHRRYRHKSKASRVKIPNRRDISERPALVAERRRYGDWEVDLIEGARGTGYLLSLYERKSRYGKLIKLTSKQSGETSRELIKALKKHRVKTLTYDNGLEFSQHEEVSKALGCKAYFCAPYASWEKGGVENYNGLVRQYYPKGWDLSQVTQRAVDVVVAQLNDRPRKVHGYRSPSSYAKKLAA